MLSGFLTRVLIVAGLIAFLGARSPGGGSEERGEGREGKEKGGVAPNEAADFVKNRVVQETAG